MTCECGITAFVKQHASLKAANTWDKNAVYTLFIQALPMKKNVLMEALMRYFRNITVIYIGETVDEAVSEKVVARFVARFPKLKNLITLLPKNSNRVQFLTCVTGTNRELHRICLTRRHIGRQESLKTASAAAEARDFQDGMDPLHHFVYDVITRPSKKDVIVTRVRWHQLYGSGEDCVNCGGGPNTCIHCNTTTIGGSSSGGGSSSSITPSYAAAYFRCTIKCVMPFATESMICTGIVKCARFF